MSTFMMPLPSPVWTLLRRLEGAGYEAWVVGGCVRDSLLGLAPKDFDICTSALPQEVQAVFGAAAVRPTGMRHGTVTVLLGGMSLEVTTFRRDGSYTDRRHPDQVRFVGRLQEDLERRDYTVNAMAYHPDRGLEDPAGGREDLGRGILRTVGPADRRFEEDPLRILRGLRFAARYGLRPSPETWKAMGRCAPLLREVAPERILTELTGLLCAPGELLGPVLREGWGILCLLPGLGCLGPMTGYDQQNPHHHLDLKEHTIGVTAAVPPKAALRYAALFHDSGKVLRRTVDPGGVAHYYGHAGESAKLLGEALRALRSDRALLEKAVELVRRHDAFLPPTLPVVRRWLGRLGEEEMEDLLALWRGDVMASDPENRAQRLGRLDAWEELIRQVLREGQCVSRKTLAVGGRDLLELGFAPGPALGRALGALLDEVLEGRTENSAEALRERAQELLQKPDREGDSKNEP